MKTAIPLLYFVFILAFVYASVEDDFREGMLVPQEASSARERGSGRRKGLWRLIPIPKGFWLRRSNASGLNTNQIEKKPCPTLTFNCANMQDVCDNMRNAITIHRKPTKLHRITGKRKIKRNRRRSGCRKLPKRPGQNCDEYPFASTREGGTGAIIKAVTISHNSEQGRQLSRFYTDSNIGDGDCYHVQIP